jgi:twitching motility protein PilI
MANREALRELQSRLAQRLQAVRGEARAASWLAVECGGQGLLVPLPTAGEIFPFAGVLPVPHTQPWFVGVANLRGGLHGVIDLAGFLGLRPTMSAPEAVRDRARLVALNATLGSHSALLVEKLAGLRNAEQMTAEPADAGPRPAFAGGRWRDTDGRVWQEIDLTALAQDEQFLAIAA